MRIAVDFDHVLFDTAGFYDEINVDIDDFKDTFEAVYLENGNEYRIEDHVEKLNTERAYDVSPSDIERMYAAAPNYLRENGLKNLSERYEVVIVTRASHRGWQKQKITASGADRYADDIVIVHGEPEDEPKNLSEADLLIDDRPKEHEYTDLPGFVYDEKTDTFDDVLQEVHLLTDGGEDS